MKVGFKKTAAISVLISPVVFFILTTIAMYLFPGGYSVNDVVFPSIHYKFKINFFSDLGMLVTETGLSNLTSSILFCVALTFVGLSFLIYAITLPSYFQKKTIQYRFAVISSFFAVISALGFIGVAFTPWDILLDLHVLFVFVAFPISIVYSSLFCIPIFMTQKYPNIFGWLLIFFSICMGIYVWFLFGGPSVMNFSGRIIQVLAQKAIVYLMMILIPIQAIGSLIMIKKDKI